MINWLKTLFYIVRKYQEDQRKLQHELNELTFISNQARKIAYDAKEFIRSKTEISADIHMRGPDRNQIIVVGRYRKRDYVQVFTTNDNDVRHLIDQLKEMQKYGVVEKVNAAPGLKAFINNELEFR